MITFCDGTQKSFLSVLGLKSEGELFIRVDWPFTECATVFSNQLKTAVMRFDYGDGNIETYSGYVMMSRIEDEGGLRVITMRKM